MSLRTKMVASLLVLAAGVLATPGVASGSPSAEASGAQAAPPKFCHVLLGQNKTSNGDSEVITQACSNESNAAAKSQFDKQIEKIKTSANTQRQSQALASGTALMTWWSNANQSGSSTVIYGNAGRCDSSGYTITPNDWWKNNMSSVVGYSYCNRMMFDNKIYSGWSIQYVSPANYLNNYNDNVGRVKIYCRYLSDCN